MMIRKSILAFAVIAAGTLSFAGQSSATPSTGDVYFNAAVPGECIFSSPVNGTAKKYSDTLLTSDPNDGQGGVSGAINLACTGSAVLTVADPVQFSGPTSTDGGNAAFVYTSAGNVVSPFGATLGFGVGTATSVQLPANFSQQAMRVDTWNKTNGAQLVAGNYAYKVTLTATPN